MLWAYNSPAAHQRVPWQQAHAHGISIISQVLKKMAILIKLIALSLSVILIVSAVTNNHYNGKILNTVII